MSVTWSGPGKALQYHLAMFEQVDRTRKWITHNNGRKVEWGDLPPIYKQRLMLMTSMGAGGPEIVVDGKTVAINRDNPMVATSEFNVARANGLMHQEYKVLDAGETHYVSHHVSAAVAAAAESADDEPLFPTDLPSPSGLIVLEYPLIVPDLHPDTGETMPELEMPIRAIGWGQQHVYVNNPDTGEMDRKEGIFYVLYTDTESYATIYVPSVARALPDLYAVEGDDFANSMNLASWAIDMSGWSFGKSWKRGGTDHAGTANADGLIHDTVALIRRFMLAYFRWTWQRILVSKPYQPSRPEIRQAMRARRPLIEGHIKVVRLRREMEAEARGEQPDYDGFFYDHAWVVRGHWRRQYYPKLGPARLEDGSFNHDSHRMVWIEPHLSGNVMGPIVHGHNVSSAVR